MEVPLLIIGAGAEDAIRKLLEVGESALDERDLVALGRLNFLSYLKSLEPPVAMVVNHTAAEPSFADAVHSLRDVIYRFQDDPKET